MADVTPKSDARPPYGGRFETTLIRYPGKGGWTFAIIPEEYAPPVTHGWGRTPVEAVVDGMAWKTSVWWDTRSQRTLLAIPKAVRRGKGHGATVDVEIRFSAL